MSLSMLGVAIFIVSDNDRIHTVTLTGVLCDVAVATHSKYTSCYLLFKVSIVNYSLSIADLQPLLLPLLLPHSLS